MKRLIFPTLLCAASVSMGCESTSSTEVGVRTSLFGIIEARGTQQVYQPGGIYVVAPFVNAWATLPIRQQNLTMNADPQESSSPIADDITFKTKDGNNVYIDVNVMWRIDAAKAGLVITQVGQSVSEIEERILRPMSRSVIRDVFNEITSEEYYQVTVKNRVAEEARQKLSEALAPYGVVIDMLQVQQHRFDPRRIARRSSSSRRRWTSRSRPSSRPSARSGTAAWRTRSARPARCGTRPTATSR
jgi:regulator of protease activity HflC (stomatin/prohibitin superfamily)